jgi:hypothetical protein
MEKLTIYILLAILFICFTTIFVMLLNAYKHIKILEQKNLITKEREKYYKDTLQKRSDKTFDDFVKHKYK